MKGQFVTKAGKSAVLKLELVSTVEMFKVPIKLENTYITKGHSFWFSTSELNFESKQ